MRTSSVAVLVLFVLIACGAAAGGAGAARARQLQPLLRTTVTGEITSLGPGRIAIGRLACAVPAAEVASVGRFVDRRPGQDRVSERSASERQILAGDRDGCDGHSGSCGHEAERCPAGAGELDDRPVCSSRPRSGASPSGGRRIGDTVDAVADDGEWPDRGSRLDEHQRRRHHLSARQLRLRYGVRLQGSAAVQRRRGGRDHRYLRQRRPRRDQLDHLTPSGAVCSSGRRPEARGGALRGPREPLPRQTTCRSERQRWR